MTLTIKAYLFGFRHLWDDSDIKKKMQVKELFKKYTIVSLLSKQDSIELLHIPGHRPIIREVLSEQAKLYELMGVKPPNLRA